MIATAFNTPINGINVLANDTGTGIILTGLLVNPVGGTFTVVGGMINFTPTPGFSGPASVTYEIGSGLNRALGTLTVNVAPDAVAPVGVADVVATTFNTALNGINVLANDTDNSGVAPTLTGVLTAPVGGTFTVVAGKINFTPTPGFTGAASVTYEITDAAGNKGTGLLTVNVLADTTLPTVNSLTVTGNIGAVADYTNTRTVAIATSGSDNVGVTGWLVTETAIIPLAAAIINAQPTTYAIVGAGDGIKSIYVWNRDAAGNVSLGQTTNITLDTGAVSLVILPNWGTGVVSGSTTTSTFTPANTNGGAMQSMTVTANNGATVSLPSGFTNFGTAVPISLVAPINNTGANITITLTFTTTNLAGTVNVTTQNLIVSPAPLAAPTGLVFDVARANLSWNPVPGAVMYRVDNTTLGVFDICASSTATTCNIT